MQVKIALAGTTPLLMHSAAGVNPEHPLVRELAVITSKPGKKRTDEDRREMQRLEWLIGLYHDGADIVYPTAAVVRCLKEAGKITKQGTQVSRGLSLDGIEAPLSFARNGHRTIEDIYADPNFVDMRPVGVGTKRVMRTRPRFMPWAVTVVGELFDDVMDVADLRRIAQLAGRAIGLGDNRINGFGRFDAEVEAA